MVSSLDLAHFVWPEVIQRHLPNRPLLVLLQSSLWDSVAVVEKMVGKRISQMSEAEAQLQSTETLSELISEWKWLQRAEDFIRAAREGLVRRGRKICK